MDDLFLNFEKEKKVKDNSESPERDRPKREKEPVTYEEQ